MAENPEKLKQRRRDQRLGGQKDSPLAHARRKAKDSRKTGVRQTRKQKDVSSGAAGRKVAKAPRSRGAVKVPGSKNAAYRVLAPVASPLEEVVNARATRYSAGTSQGGQTGRKRQGLTSPSAGRRGRAKARR